MRAFLLSLSFMLSSLSVDAQEDWFRMDSQQFWEIPALNESIDSEYFNRELLEAALFHATNDAREKYGKKAFIWNPILNKAARHQSMLMANAETLSHNWRKPRNSRKLIDRVELFGGRFKGLGENIARFYILDIPENEEYFPSSKKVTDKHGRTIENKTYKKLAQECLEAWMDSKGHRANILSSFEEIGTGASFWVANKKGPNFDIYLSQNFAIP